MKENPLDELFIEPEQAWQYTSMAIIPHKENNMIIHKHIPIPLPIRRRSKWDQKIDEMEIGDSLLFENITDTYNFYYRLRKRGFKSVVRMIRDGELWQVWKMEQPAPREEGKNENNT